MTLNIHFGRLGRHPVMFTTWCCLWWLLIWRHHLTADNKLQQLPKWEHFKNVSTNQAEKVAYEFLRICHVAFSYNRAEGLILRYYATLARYMSKMFDILIVSYIRSQLWVLLLTWINFNSSMDK